MENRPPKYLLNFTKHIIIHKNIRQIHTKLFINEAQEV